MSTTTRNTSSGAGAGQSQTTKEVVSEKVTDAASVVKDQAGEATSKARGTAMKFANQRKETLVQKGSTVTDEAEKIARQLRQDGQEKPAEMVEQAASTLQDVMGWVQEKPVEEIVADLGRRTRQSPFVFVGAMFGLGFVASRILKSAQSQGQQQWQQGYGYQGQVGQQHWAPGYANQFGSGSYGATYGGDIGQGGQPYPRTTSPGTSDYAERTAPLNRTGR